MSVLQSLPFALRARMTKSAIIANALSLREITTHRDLLHITPPLHIYIWSSDSYSSYHLANPTFCRIVIELARCSTRADSLFEVSTSKAILPMHHHSRAISFRRRTRRLRPFLIGLGRLRRLRPFTERRLRSFLIGLRSRRFRLFTEGLRRPTAPIVPFRMGRHGSSALFRVLLLSLFIGWISPWLGC